MPGFTLKKDGAEFDDEEYCTPYAGPQASPREFVAVLDVTMERRCISTSDGAALWLTGPDVTLRPFGALVHIDWLEMKSGSKAHRIAAGALLIKDQETEFLGVLPSKRKLASEVIRALHDFDDPGSPAIRRLISDRSPEFPFCWPNVAILSTPCTLRDSAM